MVQVDVTGVDIFQGVKGNAHKCPIARAMLTALHKIEPDRFGVSIGATAFGVLDYKKQVTFEFCLPIEAQLFISHFDNSGPVEPFKFEFDLESGIRSRDFDRYDKPIQVASYPLQVVNLYKKHLYEGSWDLETPISKPVPTPEDKKKFDEELGNFMKDYKEVLEAEVVTNK
jgi:hypothetical protein